MPQTPQMAEDEFGFERGQILMSADLNPLDKACNNTSTLSTLISVATLLGSG